MWRYKEKIQREQGKAATTRHPHGILYSIGIIEAKFGNDIGVKNCKKRKVCETCESFKKRFERPWMRGNQSDSRK